MGFVLVSYTPKDAGGGVPRWNRDFIRCFPGTRHYSWSDVVAAYGHDTDIPEWEKAKILSRFLRQTRLVRSDDVVIADSFWADGFEPNRTVCVRHGIWSHLTKEMVDAGMQPEFPLHSAVQVEHTRRHIAAGGKIVAVSDFIARQCQLQWGFEMGVIGNAVDLEAFRPAVERTGRRRPLIIHGVTTANKGLDHIKALVRDIDADILLLDDAQRALGVAKYEALAQADLVVQPSAYEGNSYFVLETLACGVPIVAYNVGLLNSISEIARSRGLQKHTIGCVIDRNLYSPEETSKVAKFILSSVLRDRSQYNPREVAELFGLDRFKEEWTSFLKKEFGWAG